MRATKNCPICSQSATFWRQAPDRHYGNPGVWNVYRCTHCQHLFQHPLPKEEDLLQFYPSSYYAHQPPNIDFKPKGLRHRGVWLKLHYLKYFCGYEHLPVGQNPILAFIYFSILSRKPLEFDEPAFKKNGSLLDYGSGSGHTVAFAQYTGWEAEGIEIDPIAAMAGKAAGFTIHNGSIEILEKKIARYDYITSSHCVEHVPEVRRLFKGFFKALKPGGILAIDVPNANAMAIEQYAEFYYFLTMPVHVHIFTPFSLRLLAQESGFVDISLATYGRWYTQAKTAILFHRAKRGELNHTKGFHSHSKWEGFLGRVQSLPTYVRSRIADRGDCLVMKCMKPVS